MATNKKPRKKYSGTAKQYHSPTPVLFRYTEAEGDKLKLRPRMSLEQFKDGKGTEAAFGTLEFRVFVGVKLFNHFQELSDGSAEPVHQCESSVKPTLDAAVSALKVVVKHAGDTGVWTMLEEDIVLFGDVLGIIDVMQDHTTRKEQLMVYKAVTDDLKTK